MMHRSTRAARLAPFTAAVLALLLSASACEAQPGARGGAINRSATGRAVPPPDSVLARASRAREKGSPNAPVMVVEVSDFQCPYCRQWFETSYRQFDSAYVRTGKVRMVFINLPLPMHNQAFAAAKAASCAGAQGKFWEMHDRLFSTQREWNGQADAAQRFARFALELGVDPAAYRDCIDNERTSSIILNDVMQASGAGINGTPAFVVNNQRILNGAIPFADLSREIEAALAAPRAPAPGAAPAPPPPPPAP